MTTAPPVPTTPPTPIAPSAAPETPPAPPAPRAARKPAPQRQTRRGHRVVLFGPGGVQKTTLCALLQRHVGKTVFFDLDESLEVLGTKFREFDIEMPEAVPAHTWAELRGALQADRWGGVNAIVIDTATRAEEMAIAYTLATVKTDRGRPAESIEDYGYGKGYQHVFETWLPLLGDLDAHVRAGRHVVLVCHECNSTVPNPSGNDWLRFEPRLQTSSTGKASVRLRVKEWADHVLFQGYDVAVSKDGKATGSVARVYPCELPWAMAKSRTLVDSLDLTDAFESLWPRLLV